MKPFREQNYYELLDLAPDAGADAVAKAYASAKRMFSADALGSYSLFDPAEREALWSLLKNGGQVVIMRQVSYHRGMLSVFLPVYGDPISPDAPSPF